MNRKRPRKLGFGPLALLEWLCGAVEGERMFSVSGGPASGNLYLFEAGKPGPGGVRELHRIIPGSDGDEGSALIERLGGRGTIETYGLTAEGFAAYSEQSSARGATPPHAWADFGARYETRPFRYTDTVFVPQAEAFAYWNETGKAHLEALRASRLEERRLVDRTVLIKGTWHAEPTVPPDVRRTLPSSFRMPFAPRPIERPYALARVTKVTDTRVYVESVERLPAPGAGRWRGDVVQRSGQASWVGPDAVWLDPASRRAALAIAEATDAYARDEADALSDAIRDIAPILAHLDARLAQKAAMRDDEVREIMEREAALASRAGSEETVDRDDGDGLEEASHPTP